MNEQSLYHRFVRVDFELSGWPCILARPDHALPGNPWLWRAEFFGAFDTVDAAMLRMGYHVAYVRLSDRYGCPSAVQDMEAFRQHMVREFHLSEKPILIGMSRGGLYSVNYALRYPLHVSGLYLDAPVLDIRSWPGGKGAGSGDEACWRQCLDCYGLTEETVKDFHMNPLDRAEELAALRIPVALVAGLADEAVPYVENGLPFSRRFAKAGGQCLVILKPDCGHHPHSLPDPTPVVRFLDKIALESAEKS